jgi:hypothetical protein
MGAFKILEQNHLGYSLIHTNIKELSFLSIAPCDIYTYFNGNFEISIPINTPINKDLIKRLVMGGRWQFFVHHKERELIIFANQEKLRKITRSISIGDAISNCKTHANLLNLNLSFVYDSPSNDEYLNLQFQSVRNLAQFLLENPKLLKDLYLQIVGHTFHYTLSQPLASSILLLAFLKKSYHFTPKEMENLFLTSYFKDIGMSTLSRESLSKPELNLKEKLALNNHAHQSSLILDGRIPLGPAYLEIIKNHHTHTLLDDDEHDDEFRNDSQQQHSKTIDGSVLSGIETGLVAAMDTIAAMTSDRPYRNKISLYTALDIVKENLSARYPQEFKFLVQFFQGFLK